MGPVVKIHAQPHIAATISEFEVYYKLGEGGIVIDFFLPLDVIS